MATPRDKTLETTVFRAGSGDSRPVHAAPPGSLAEEESSDAVTFSDLEEHWSPILAWVSWFLRFGYLWSEQQGRRRICVLSTPCDSPAAALIALGLMRRRLEVPDAGDLAMHLRRLRELYHSAREGTILRRVNNRKRFVFCKADANGTLWAHRVGDANQKYKIIEEFAFDWHVDGEPPVQDSRGAPMVPTAILRSLFNDARPILQENLTRTDSAICFAGRAAGGSQTRAALSTVRFQQGGEISSLGSLLTIHGWHDGCISRVRFYNARTRAFDRAGRLPLVVSADGAASFARVLSDSSFTHSDVIAAIPRTSDPDRMDGVVERLASLAQWYTPSDAGVPSSGDTPIGVSIVMLQKD